MLLFQRSQVWFPAPIWCWQLSAIAVPENLMPCSSSCHCTHTMHRYTCRQITHIFKIKIKYQKIKYHTFLQIFLKWHLTIPKFSSWIFKLCKVIDGIWFLELFCFIHETRLALHPSPPTSDLWLLQRRAIISGLEHVLFARSVSEITPQISPIGSTYGKRPHYTQRILG